MQDYDAINQTFRTKKKSLCKQVLHVFVTKNQIRMHFFATLAENFTLRQTAFLTKEFTAYTAQNQARCKNYTGQNDSKEKKSCKKIGVVVKSSRTKI